MRPKEYTRKKLMQELEVLWDKPLTVVTAPSGYGKTTLMKSFFRGHPEAKVAWVSIGHHEPDAAWLWQKICDNIKEVSANKEIAKFSDLPEDEKGIDELLKGVRSFQINRPFCVVLDDYHECNNPIINHMLEKLTWEEIHNLHIIILSRKTPDIACEELYLKDYCLLIGQKSLALSREEIVEIFHMNEVDLADKVIDRILEFTGGWISAIYLLLAEYNIAGYMGDFNSITHLLKHAIYDELAPQVQEILMKLSPFDSFSVEGASYVTGRPISATVLMQIREHYGFIHYDISSGRYRMHTLLQTVAAKELDRSDVNKVELFNRAGEWYLSIGDITRGFLYYYRAGNRQKAFSLLSGEHNEHIIETLPTVVNDLFLNTPVEEKTKYPIAWLKYIYYVILRDDFVWGRYLYEEADNAYQQVFAEKGRDNTIAGNLLIVRSMLEFNHLEKINASLKEAWEILGRTPSGIFGRNILTIGAPFMTSMYYSVAGSLQRTISLEKEYAKYQVQLSIGVEDDWAEYFDAEYALMTGDMERANTLAVQATRRALLKGQKCMIISGFYIQLRCLICLGDCQEFWRVMERLQNILKERAEGVERRVLSIDGELAYSYVYAALEQKEQMAGWICNLELGEVSRVIHNIRSACIVYGMLLCRQGQWERLNAVAEQVIVPYESTRHAYSIVKGYLFKAIALYHLGYEEKGYTMLKQAIAMSERDELRIPFIENAPELEELFKGLDQDTAFIRSLYPPMRQYTRALQQFQGSGKRTSLTEREKELMRLVKKGMRNREIGKELNIAMVTVEKNLTSVYRKLNVSNRAAAVAKLEEVL